MKKGLLGLVLFLLCLCVYACSDKEAQQQDVLARINDYNLTLNEFNADLRAELEMTPDFKMTPEAKKKFLNSIIEKQLLIQEAKKLGLDRKEKFVRAIERYWESTLIRDLVEIKGKEISEQISIPENELKARVAKIEKSGKAPENPEMAKEKALKELKDQKKRQILRQWIRDLRKSAEIEINQGLLKKRPALKD